MHQVVFVQIWNQIVIQVKQVLFLIHFASGYKINSVRIVRRSSMVEWSILYRLNLTRIIDSKSDFGSRGLRCYDHRTKTMMSQTSSISYPICHVTMIIIMVGTTDSIRPGYHPQDRLSDSTVRSLISRVLDRRSDRLDRTRVRFKRTR